MPNMPNLRIEVSEPIRAIPRATPSAIQSRPRLNSNTPLSTLKQRLPHLQNQSYISLLSQGNHNNTIDLKQPESATLRPQQTFGQLANIDLELR
jgi:hypothetical protein